VRTRRGPSYGWYDACWRTWGRPVPVVMDFIQIRCPDRERFLYLYDLTRQPWDAIVWVGVEAVS